MADDFVHLHNHTEYSMLDGAARIEELVLAAKADGQRAIGITDHGNLYGIIDFYNACRKHDVKPVLGLEAYMVAGSRFDRHARRGKVDDGGGDAVGGGKLYNHLTLLAENSDGYRNLRELASYAFLEGYYTKPRVDFELLEKYAGGLIATSGCLGGLVLQCLMADDYQGAKEYAARFQTIFGRDNFFIELQDHFMPEQRKTNPMLLQLAKDINAPLLATNDLHYINHADWEMHDALLCIGTGARMSDTDRFRFASDQHYLKTAAEMRHLFAEVPEACDNTLWVAERSEVDIKFDNDALPEFPIPAEFANEDHKVAANAYLRHLVYEGARFRYGQDLSNEVVERVDYELATLANMGFSDYFLVVWDLIRHAREVGIRVGPGRGSAAGSCIAYCLRIVDLDPIRYGLLFERFLNPARKSMPDIDMDFDERFRGDMIKYAAERYGTDHVAQIITFSTIKSRAAVRDAARVLGYPPNMGDTIAKAMPPLVVGKELPLAACFTPMPGYEDRFGEAQDLRTLYEQDQEAKHVIDTALGFVDKRRQDGIHAAAVVITKDPVLDYVPIQRKTGANATEEAPIVTQYEAKAIEKLGLLKMDFLGLRNLAIVERALEHIERRHGAKVDIDNVDLTDAKVFALMQKGNTIGIFQLEGDKMRQLMRRLAPTSFDDVAALVALYRPGAMSSNAHNDFADRKNGRQAISYDHPELEKVLKDTHGLMIYQEDIMRVATHLAGFTMSEADDLRKATSKKDRDMIQLQRVKFVEGVVKMGYEEQLGTDLFDKIEPFADYAFNKSHAYGYALIAYQNAWLKANYPVEYMAALLTSFRDDKDKASLYLNDARMMGITVGVPSVNDSLGDYAPSLTEENTVVFGMAAIRNVGEGLVNKIVEERDANGPFTSIYDFVRRVDPMVLNKRSMEALIKGGAFDCLGVSRQGLLLRIDELIDVTLARRKDLSLGITTLFAAFGMEEGGGDDWEGTELPISSVEFDSQKKLDFEREMLGTYISDHPLFGVRDQLASKVDQTAASLREAGQELSKAKQVVRIGGIITNLQVRLSKQNKQYATLTIEDLTGSLEVFLYNKAFETEGAKLAKDAIVVIKAMVSETADGVRITGLSVDRLKAGSTAAELRLYLRPEDLSNEAVAVLREILRNHPGTAPVIVETGDAKAFRLGPEFNVNIASVVADLREEFGRNVIRG